MICVSIAQITQIVEVLRSGVGLIELRLDLMGKFPAEIYTLIPQGTKTIATCRPGIYSEEEKILLLKSCMDLGASFIDIEIESSRDHLNELINYAQKCGSGVLISYHNFDQTPNRSELVRMMNMCYTLGGTIAKIASHVNSVEDIRNLISLYDTPGKKIVIGMGKLGRITRIMAPYLGAEFTFASPGVGGGTAPGQLSLKQLNELYKVIDES